MKLAELKQALRAVEPAAVLVSPWVLYRVIQQSRKLPGWLWDVPHGKSYVIDRHELFQYVEQDDLDLAPDELLPPAVILLARPSLEDLSHARRGPVLQKYWRRLFHANIHRLLESRWAEGSLGPEDIRQRIGQIGRTEFEEIRLILRQDRYLLPPADDRSVYIEFAAVFLELRSFAANLLPIFFPGLDDFDRIAQLLGQDVDAAALFAQTRPANAPDPVPVTDNRSNESDDYFWKLVRTAEQAARSGNTVRAAILRTRAARVAPASLTAGTQARAEADLTRLARRLQNVLGLSDAETAEWEKDLPPLLNKADQGTRPVEANLLFDLQKVCLEQEREIYTLDLVEWVLSGGKRPIKRPLPGQRLVRIIKHLRSAGQRLTMARLADADRLHLDGLMQAALDQTEGQLRVRFRLILTEALQDAGLRPANTPERTAFAKMIEELLDRITRDGFITFGDLRDAISRNQLKLPDLEDPQDCARGDALTRLDRRLAVLLDGVYRPGEVYQRLLERFTAVAFGTTTGRWLTRNVALPFGGGLVLAEGLQLILEKTGAPTLPLFVRILLCLSFGLFILGLLHSPDFRGLWVRQGRRLGRTARKIFRDIPSRLLHHPTLRRFLRSWTAQLFAWYLLQPLVLCAFLWPLVPDLFSPWHRAVISFLAAMFLLNTRLARAGVDAIIQSMVRLFELLRGGLVPGLFRLIVRLFKQIVHLLEAVLFAVDEWLCFRTGDNWLSMVVRTVLGVLWFPVSFVIRFYALVLIEPGINPIKFPISSIAAKFIYPFGLVLAGLMSQVLTPLVGTILAHLVAGTTVWLLPDAFGFLFWEMKENWGLYRANRRPLLEPVVAGPHGETVRRLLQPGFHSGTVPKLFARLREAEHAAAEVGNWRGTRLVRQSLQEVERSLRQFLDRELVTLLQKGGRWQWQRLRPGRVGLATNRIGLELVNDDYPDNPVGLEVEDRAGWLVAGVRRPGWMGQLPAEQRQALGLALAGLYKLAGVDLVREQIAANLPAGVSSYDITPQGLVLWLDQQPGRALLYPLGNPDKLPRAPQGNGLPAWPETAPDPAQMIFARVPLTWQQWVDSWPQGHEGQASPVLLPPGVNLLPPLSTLPPQLPPPRTEGSGEGEGVPGGVPSG